MRLVHKINKALNKKFYLLEVDHKFGSLLSSCQERKYDSQYLNDKSQPRGLRSNTSVLGTD